MLHIHKCRATAEERAYLALTRARAQGGLNFTNIVKCTIPVEHMVKVRDFGHVYNDGKVRLQICSMYYYSCGQNQEGLVRPEFQNRPKCIL